jgi:hypothetical protein
MYRQLYMGGGIGSLDAGAPSIKYEGDIRPQMTSAPDPMDALNDLAMQLFGKPLDMLTPSERQALDEYNSGMMAVGGRVNYGIGSKLKKFAKKVIDPVAQVAAFIPGVHQPFAQGYTALRASGVGGDNYGGLQVLGMTPGAGQFQPYGQQGGQQGGFRIQDFIPTFDATNPNTGESIFNPDGTLKSGSTTSSSRGFFEKAKKAAEGIKSVYDQVSDSVSGQEIYRKAQEAKKQKSIPDTVKDILLDTALGKNRDDGLRRGTSAYLAKKAYDDQVRYNELLKKQYEDYIAATGAARTKFADKSKLKGYEVTGVPRSARDVVRAPVMGGGIMNTRKGYNMGSVGSGLGAGFEGLFQDTIGTTMLGPNIEDEIMRRARKFMQMTDDVDAAYKMAEMEFMSELESKYPGFYEGIGTLPEDLSGTVNKQLKAYGGRMGYAGGTIDKDYEAWKRMYEKSQDAAEGLNPIKNQEYIQRYKQEKNNRTKYAIGGDTSEPISSFEQNTMMASPDWYVKRVEILMELGYDYDTASEIAYDSDRYYDTVGGMNKGGRPGYALGDTATMAAQVERLPLRNNQAGITELDLRDSGGFIPPVGIKEKADDIPAMLSNNEFVFTADAVRGMGDGNVDVGAKRMYDIMKKLEKGGRV